MSGYSVATLLWLAATVAASTAGGLLIDHLARHKDRQSDWDRHVDQALEAAEPTPDLRRVQ